MSVITVSLQQRQQQDSFLVFATSIKRWPLVISMLSLGYLVLCRLLRFRRLDRMRKKYTRYSTRASLSTMTGHDAQQIMLYLFELEFPEAFRTSLGFALFRVCTILVVIFHHFFQISFIFHLHWISLR